jgi:hypothetical protein
MIMVISLIFSGCDFNAAQDAIDDFDVIVALEEVNSFVTITFVDTQSQSFLSEEVNMSFRGDNASSVVDMFSDPVAELSVSGGLGSFGIRNSLVPSASSPVTIRVVASASGYDPGSVTVSLESTGQTSARVYMTRTAQVIQGAVSTTDTNGAAGAGGVVTQAVTAQTNTNAQNQVSASVSVPVGTTAQTSTGQSATGTLTTTVNLYTANTASSAQALSGGYSTSVQSTSGTVSQTAITTAGFMNVTVTDAAGNEITQFNPPIQLSMEVAAGTFNRRTGAVVKTGDTFGIYSYDETDGLWVEEGESILTGPDSDGNFEASFDTDHLSEWIVGEAGNTCDSGEFTVNRNGNTGPIFVAVGSFMPEWFPGVFTIPAGENTLTIRNAPNNLGQYFLAFSHPGVPSETINDAVAANGSICGATGSVTFSAPPANIVDVTFTLDLEGDGNAEVSNGTCSSLRVTNVPVFTIFIKEPGQTDADARSIGTDPVFTRDNLNRINGGSLLVSGLEVGRSYVFYTTVNNERQERTITVSGAAMFLDISGDVQDADICSQ